MGTTGYIDKRLRRTNERIVYRAHLSWIPVFTSAIPLLGLTSVFAGATLGVFDNMSLCIVVLGIGLLLTLVTRIPKIIRNIGTDIVVTDRRLHTKRGIINIDNDRETPLTNVDDTIADPGPIGRVLGYGNVSIHTFGGGQGAGDEFEFRNVSDPFELVAVINETRDQIANGRAASPYGGYSQGRGGDSFGRDRDYGSRDDRGYRDSYDDRDRRGSYDDRDRRGSYDDRNRNDPFDGRNRRDSYGRRDERDYYDRRR